MFYMFSKHKKTARNLKEARTANINRPDNVGAAEEMVFEMDEMGPGATEKSK
jgi:hypothetical protein